MGPLAGGAVLKDRFSGLFDLAKNKIMSVLEMNQLGRGRVVRLGSGVDVYFLGRRGRLRRAFFFFVA